MKMKKRKLAPIYVMPGDSLTCTFTDPQQKKTTLLDYTFTTAQTLEGTFTEREDGTVNLVFDGKK